MEAKKLDSGKEAKYSETANIDLMGKNPVQLRIIRTRNIRLAIKHLDEKSFGRYYRSFYRYMDAEKLLKKQMENE